MLEHPVQILWRRQTNHIMHGPSRALEVSLVELDNCQGCADAGDRRSLQNLVVERNGKFSIAESCTNEDVEAAPDNSCVGDGFPPEGIDHRLARQLDPSNDEAAA